MLLRLVSIPAICLLLALAACSGGAGGGGGGGGGSGFSISFDTARITLHAVYGQPANQFAALVHATGSGPAPTTMYIGATDSGQGFVHPFYVEINAATKSGVLTALADTTLAPGEYTGQLTISACPDASCSTQFSGSPHVVDYTVVVEPTLTATPSALSLSTFESAVGNSVSVQISKDAASVVTVQSNQPWVQASVQGATLQVNANGVGVLAGTYQAQLDLHIANPFQTFVLPVTVIVSPALQAPSSLSFTLDGHTAANALGGSFAVNTASGTSIANWTATSDAPWLVLDQAAGAVGQSVTWHLDKPAVTALKNATQYVAHVALTGGSAATPVSVAFNFSKNLPEIRDLDRLGLLADQPGKLTLYGSGFSTIASLTTDLHVGGIAPTSTSVLNDRVITLSMPAQSTGEFNVGLTNPAGIATRARKVTVLAPVDRSYQVLQIPGSKRAAAWDALTQSAYAIDNATQNAIVRVDLSQATATWASYPTTGASQLNSIGFALDHAALLSLDLNGDLRELSTADMSVLRTRSLGFPIFNNPPSHRLAVTGDDVLWVLNGAQAMTIDNLVAYDLLSSTSQISFAPNSGFRVENNDYAAVSANGGRMLVTPTYTLDSPVTSGLYWDNADGMLHATPGGVGVPVNRYATDRAGQKWTMFDYHLRDYSLNDLGEMLLPAHWFGAFFAISNDGTYAYRYALNDAAIGTFVEPNPIVWFPRIYVYDLAAPHTPGTPYSDVGYVELPDYPSCRATQGPVACSPYDLSFMITDDDRTLLAMGDQRLIVVPIPSNLRSH